MQHPQKHSLILKDLIYDLSAANFVGLYLYDTEAFASFQNFLVAPFTAAFVWASLSDSLRR